MIRDTAVVKKDDELSSNDRNCRRSKLYLHTASDNLLSINSLNIASSSFEYLMTVMLGLFVEVSQHFRAKKIMQVQFAVS